MGDLADAAMGAIELMNAAALQRAVGRSAPEHHIDFDGTHCVADSCGIEIPKARLKLGRVRCVDCQSLLEKGKL